MQQPTLHYAKNWPKRRRIDEAIRKCLNDGWSQTEAARSFGVSRQHLNRRIREIEVERAAEAERAGELVAEAASSPLGLKETRRIQPPVEFHRTYFGHIPCPDCESLHPMPSFHEEIIDLCQTEGVLRGGVNLPPYHAKTTVGSIRDTIYDICKNPNSRTMIVSKSQTFASQILQAIGEHLVNHELYDGAGRNLIDDWGPFRDANHSNVWNQNQLYVAGRVTSEKDPTVQALGWGNQIYGRRADKIKFDDIADTENQANPQQVQKMLAWIDKMALSRIGQRGRALWFGTRVNAGDIYSVLSKREGYRWLRYPFITDEENERTLWPDHFGFAYANVLRAELSPSDWQLIYQNVEVMGVGADFTDDMLEAAFDGSRVLGMWQPGWRLIAGLDLAGGTKDSGFTAFTLLGVDPGTGRRFLVDQYAEKSMKAPAIKDKMLEWSATYPIYEWRVENNAVQSQVVQYNDDIIRPLAMQGIRVQGHNTNSNKWDPQFGVSSIAPLFNAGLMNLPYGNLQTQREMKVFAEELLGFPMAPKNDRVMSFWFAELGCRDIMRRAHLPAFDERTRHWPARIRRNRKIVDFHNREVRPVSLLDQYRGAETTVGQAEYRRRLVGRPDRHGHDPGAEAPVRRKLVNVPGEVLVPAHLDGDSPHGE